MLTQQDKYILKELKRIVTYYDNRILNWAIGDFDESKVNRDNLGRFAKHKAQDGELTEELKQLLGEEFTGFKGQAAINKVYKEQRGYVKYAFYRDIIGNISVFWGDSKCGLKHIIEHRKERNIDPKEFLKGLGKVIEQGSIDFTYNDDYRWIIKYKGKKAIISKELRNNKFICLLTAFL